jgi:hypothetical protein
MTYLSPEYRAYIDSPKWAEKSLKCRQKAGWRCQKCGCRPPKYWLHAHHRTYARLFHEWARDLVALCSCPQHRCHQKAHEAKRRRQSVMRFFGF